MVRCTLIVALLAAAPAAAQGPSANDPDARELAAYTLTVPALDKALAATRNMVAAAKNDPRFQKQLALKAEIAKLEAKAEPTDAETARLDTLRTELETAEASIFPGAGAQTLSEMEAAMQKEPLMAKALADAGIAPREYAKLLFVYAVSVNVASEMEQRGVTEIPKVRAGTVTPANVTFFQAHKAEVEAFQKAMEALAPPQ